MFVCETNTYLQCIEEVLIDFQEVIGEHSGANLAAAVWQTIDCYGLAGKVFKWFHTFGCLLTAHADPCCRSGQCLKQ